VRSPIPALVALSVRAPRRMLLLALLLVTLALGFAVRNFAMTTDTGALISPQVDWRQQERTMETAFPQLRDVMLVVVDGATPELAQDATDRLAKALAADPAHFRRVEQPDGGDFFAREGLLYQSPSEVRQMTASLVEAQPMLGPLASDPSLRGVATALSTMLEGVAHGDAQLGQIARPMRALSTAAEQAAAGKPAFFSWQKLLAEGGSVSRTQRRLILVQPVLDHSALMPGEAATRALISSAARLGLDQQHGVRVRLTGEVPLADQEFATLAENIGLVAAVMWLAMLLTLWLAIRSVRLVLAIVVTIIAGLVVTTALGLLTVGRFNLISVAFIPLFVGLGVDFGIQLCVRFNAERAKDDDVRAALSRAASALGIPLLLAAGAICLGFTAFLPTAYIGIAELGVIAGCGMAVALLFSVTLLPALVMLMPPRKASATPPSPRLAKLDDLLIRKRHMVLWAFGLSMIGSIALLPLVRFDFNPLHLRDPASPAMATLTDLMRDPDRTPNTIDVLASNDGEARALAKRLAQLPEVGQVISIDSFVPDEQPAKLAMISDASLLLDPTLNPFDLAAPPTDRETVAALSKAAAELRAAAGIKTDAPASDARRLANAFERLARGAPSLRERFGHIVAMPLVTMLDQIRMALQAQPVTRATLPAELQHDWITPDGRMRLQVFPRGNSNDNDVIAQFRAAVTKVTPKISGLPVATQAAASTVAFAFIQAGVLALGLVSILLFVALRDIKEVAFTLAPVVLSGFLTLGTCVLIGQPINFANIIAFPLLFGVGVAFHIYFVMAWRGGATDLLQSSLARAILFSALATGTAFGSLWLSHHPGTASMGKILMISLIWTLICALIFEPALLGPPARRARPANSLH